MVSSFAAIRSSVHRAMEERVSSERGGEEEVVFTTHAIQAWIPSLTSTPGIAETKQWSMSIYRRATFAPSKGGKRVNVCRKSDAFLVFIFSCVHWLADVDRSWKNWWIGVGTIYFRTKKRVVEKNVRFEAGWKLVGIHPIEACQFYLGNLKLENIFDNNDICRVKKYF